MVVGAISMKALLSSKYAQIRAMSAKMVRRLKGAKRGMWIPQTPVSPSELCRKISRGVIVVAGAAVLFYTVVMCWFVSGMLEGDVTLTPWALHGGVWGCIIGALGIVWGIRKRCNQVSRRRSKPSNVIRKHLNRTVTLGFFAEQQVFVTPWADGIGISQKQYRPLMTHASGKSAGQNQ